MSATTARTKPADLTNRLAVYPSDAIRPVPPFVFSVPEGWVIDEGPDALALVRTEQQDDGFWVNLMVTHDRVAQGVDHKSVAQATWARLVRTSPEAKVTMERLVRFGDRITYLRAVDLAAPRSGAPLAQLQALFFGPHEDGRKTIDLFQMIGTCTAGRADAHGPAFLEIIGSFRFS